MSIKIYLKFEEAGLPEKSTKISVPKAWVTGKSVADIIGLFAKGFNDKNPGHEIDVENAHLVDADGNKIFSNVICGTVLHDHSDYHIKRGSYTQRTGADENAQNANKIRCKNYGCNKYYAPEENHDAACRHHTGPPIFHDTMKCWSCCRDRKAYDFDAFQLIQGCAVGPHSDVNVGQTLGAAREEDPSAPAPVALKSIADFNTQNPDAASSVSQATKIVTTRKSSRSADGLTARCQRRGCQKQFAVADNHETDCKFHRGQAIFHDAYKYWSCCPDQKKMEFEAFLEIPGCAVGFHDDGEIELQDL